MIILIHSTVNVLNTDCSYPKGFDWAFIIYGIVITILFLNFYSKSYTENKSKKLLTNGVAAKGTNGIKKRVE
jgi:hypothetical protein